MKLCAMEWIEYFVILYDAYWVLCEILCSIFSFETEMFTDAINCLIMTLFMILQKFM